MTLSEPIIVTSNVEIHNIRFVVTTLRTSSSMIDDAYIQHISETIERDTVIYILLYILKIIKKLRFGHINIAIERHEVTRSLSRSG